MAEGDGIGEERRERNRSRLSKIRAGRRTINKDLHNMKPQNIKKMVTN